MANTIASLSREQTPLHDLSDVDVVQEVTRRAAKERHATADLIRALIEFDDRRLYLSQGFPSLFAYCTEALHYSEYGAFNRIEVARAAARFPQLLTALEDGSLHLTAARLLAPHLTDENVDAAIESARHKSKRDVEVIAAELAQRTLVLAVNAVQYRLNVTISRAALDKMRQVKALLGYKPSSRDADGLVFEEAITLLLDKVQRQRLAAAERYRAASAEEPSVVTEPVESAAASEEGQGEAADAASNSRHISRAVKQAVWDRDQGRCAFVGVQGRCTAIRELQYHHVVPFAAGGRATKENIELRCGPHNRYEAELYFGADVVAAARERRQSRGTPAPSTPPDQGCPGTSSGHGVASTTDPAPPASAHRRPSRRRKGGV